MQNNDTKEIHTVAKIEQAIEHREQWHKRQRTAAKIQHATEHIEQWYKRQRDGG